MRNLSEIAAASESATQVMTMLLLSVASISLLVGGIGIMNIMLVSVTERTREIGIRMAIGARRIHIMLQFLVEAMLLSAMGGFAGIVLGILVSKLISARGGVADAGLAGGGCGRVYLFGGGGSFLRLLSGAQSELAASNRRAALRIAEPGARLVRPVV